MYQLRRALIGALEYLLAAEDLWAKGLVLIHQQGIQSEEAWVQREANWAGRSLSDEPWVGMTVGWLQNLLVNVVVLMELRQTLPQPSISTGHRAVGEASESSAFCHPGSHLLGCKLSVHLMWRRLCPELGCWVMLGSGLCPLQLSGVRAPSCNFVPTLAKWRYVLRLEQPVK